MAAPAVPLGLERYLQELLERVGAVVDLRAAYLLGSGALGAFDPETSDVDVVAVTPEPLSEEDKRAVVAAAESLAVPARKLELVVYAAGRAGWELNLNTGERVSLDPAEEPPFWFVLDRAIAEQQSVALVGPPWNEVFAPVARPEVLAALAEALDWHEANEPATRNAVLNLCRAWAWVETGRWRSKPDAAAWLRGRVREAIEAAP